MIDDGAAVGFLFLHQNRHEGRSRSTAGEPTRELMEDFYGRLLAGEGLAEALRQAQLAMKTKYPEPFYWGAFICQGDPSRLGKVEWPKERAAVSDG